jgi:hypothetical protein
MSMPYLLKHLKTDNMNKNKRRKIWLSRQKKQQEHLRMAGEVYKQRFQDQDEADALRREKEEPEEQERGLLE